MWAETETSQLGLTAKLAEAVALLQAFLHMLPVSVAQNLTVYHHTVQQVSRIQLHLLC